MKCLACHCFGSALAAVLARAREKALDCAVSLGTYGERLLWSFQFIAPKLVSPLLFDSFIHFPLLLAEGSL